MFKMFSKKLEGVQDVSPIGQVEEVPSLTQDNFDIKRHIQALLDNDFAAVPAGDDEVVRLVRQLVEKLQFHIMGEMSRCVKLSIEANETAIFSAKMLVELKDVEAQTQGISAASEEMVATVSEIERYGMSIADQAQDAQNATKSGSSAVQNAVENMEHITNSVQQGVEQVSILAGFTDEISGIADDIKKIAEQTNLLALNATIEAARAGDAGKGFAVVAGEVKILSGETAKSTESINEIIANLQNATMNISQSMENSTRAIATGREAMTGLGEGMGEINEKINIVTENIAQISNVLGEQSQASSEVAQGVVLIAAAGRKSVAGIEHIVNSMDKVEGLISGQIGALAEYDIPNEGG
ncbi:MAG: chemotaxis protein [Alphaproteobacteria bacterium]|nr:MAG: chemotaxis protein [Alphaproteobacteria bacterium]